MWFLSLTMARIHFSAICERWSSAFNTDAFIAAKIGDNHLFGVAEGLSDLPHQSSASGTAISSLIQAVRDMKGSPVGALNSALRDSESRIHARVGSMPEMRDTTHLSACVVNENLDCSILDTGEGHLLLINREGIFVPQNYPDARFPADPALISAVPPGRKSLQDMISYTLGEPHLLKHSDFVQTNIRDLFLVISSGGLHDFVRQDVIARTVLDNGENVETACQKLVNEAHLAGSERTTTVILVHGHEH